MRVPEKNPNGIKLLRIISKFRILIFPPSKHSKPTFQRSGRTPNILDIALISNRPTTLRHHVINELDSNSPVITTLKKPLIVNSPIPKLTNAPINWLRFREKLNENLSCSKQYRNPDDINTSIEYLTNTIKNSINLSLIKNNKTINHSSDSLPTSIQYLINQKYKARIIWQNTRNLDVKRRLNQLARRVKWNNIISCLPKKNKP